MALLVGGGVGGGVGPAVWARGLRRADRAGEGVVARYDAERGFGFITPDAGGADLFVHLSVLVDTEPLERMAKVIAAFR